VKIGRFGQSDSDLLFQETEEGNIVVLVDEVLRQLHRKFLIRAVSFEGVHRIETPPYPMPALREMLLNALIHRSYTGAPTQIRVYDNAISFWNVGGLPEGITLDALKRRHSSNPRNLVLADVAFKGGYIDAWGRGTIKIIDACRNAGLPEPEMKESDGGFLMTLRRPDGAATQQATDQVTHQVNALENKELSAKPDGNGCADPIRNPISNPISNASLTPQVESLLRALQARERGGRGIMEVLVLKDYMNFKYSYLEPALYLGLVEMTQPNSPRSPTQKYRLTAKGLAVLIGKPSAKIS
jgi:ATP-dependent DNA helicase RecG